MSDKAYEAYAKYAGHGGARNGSPYTAGRAFKRRSSAAVQVLRAVRDLLALLAVVTIIVMVCAAFTVAPHWA